MPMGDEEVKRQMAEAQRAAAAQQAEMLNAADATAVRGFMTNLILKGHWNKVVAGQPGPNGTAKEDIRYCEFYKAMQPHSGAPDMDSFINGIKQVMRGFTLPKAQMINGNNSITLMVPEKEFALLQEKARQLQNTPLFGKPFEEPKKSGVTELDQAVKKQSAFGNIGDDVLAAIRNQLGGMGVGGGVSASIADLGHFSANVSGPSQQTRIQQQQQQPAIPALPSKA